MMSNSPASRKGPEASAVNRDKKSSEDRKSPVLNLAGYYGSPSVQATAFVRAFGRSAKRSIDPEERAVALKKREATDANYGRTLELAIAAIGAPTQLIKAMFLSWIAEVIRRDIGKVAPGVAFNEGTACQVFRSLTEALVAERSREGAKQGPIDQTQAADRATQASSTAAPSPARVPDPKLAAQEKRQRQRTRINFSLLALAYLTESRGLSIIEARPYLARLLQTSKTDRKVSSTDAIALLAGLRADRLSGLLGIIGLWDGAVVEARREAARSQDAEERARADAAELQLKLKTLRTEIEDLKDENARLVASLQDVERQALAERQRSGALDRERRGRLFRFVSEQLAQRIALIEEALEVEPPVVDVALDAVREMERDRAEEGRWLKSLE